MKAKISTRMKKLLANPSSRREIVRAVLNKNVSVGGYKVAIVGTTDSSRSSQAESILPFRRATSDR